MTTEKSWAERFDEILPLIVEDYNNFIAEAGEIGEMDIEEIWENRVKPLIVQVEHEAVERTKKEISELLKSDYHTCIDGCACTEIVIEDYFLPTSPIKDK